MNSIGTRLMIGVSLLFLLLILLIYCANLFFLDDYYLLQTKGQFEEESRYLLLHYGDRQTNFLNILRNRSSETGLKYMVSDKEKIIIFHSAPEFRTEVKIRLSKQMIDITNRRNTNQFYGIVQRENSKTKDIVLAENLSRNEVLFITLPLENLKTNARIANQFLLIIGTFVFLLSLLITRFFARTVVKPVEELTLLSSRIENLDFSQRYRGKRDDEIGRLGMSLNKTSGKLEKTIGELKEEMVLQKRFLASISHELKSPVALIRGYSEAMNLPGMESQSNSREFTDIIISESDRLNLLINDLLQLVQMDSVTFSLSKRDFNLVETIEGIIRKNDLPIKKHHYTLEWNHPETVFLMGDEKRLTQAVDNLLSNAVKHCPEDGRITINLVDREDGLHLEIINDGDAIPEEHREHLFEPFYSAHSGREREKTGSGLGLSIVRSIIEKHSGSCDIENTEKGVRVSFFIPHNPNTNISEP